MEFLNLLDGKWRRGHGQRIAVTDPYSGETLGQVSAVTPEEAREALRAMEARRPRADAIVPLWRRKELLELVADNLESRRADVLRALTHEAGKTVKESSIEIERAVDGLKAMAAALVSLEGTVVPMSSSRAGEGRLGFEVWEPAGIVVAIAPFNAPLNLVSSKVGAALAGGCAVAVKPPAECPTPAAILAECVLDAGWPEELIAVLNGEAEVGQAMVAAPEPRVIAFTGSSGAGEAIARAAGLKRLILELGSIAPTIICDDADVDDAVARLGRGAFGSAGQACISTQRLLVQEPLVEAVIEGLVDEAESLVVGDPSDAKTDVGPLINDRAAVRVRELLNSSRGDGARFHTGGRIEGRMVWPTVLSGLPPTSRICREEIFGPAVTIIPFVEDDEAIEEANTGGFGLQAGVFTRDILRVNAFCTRLEYGSVQVNESSRVRLDGHAFGGLKRSGIGREGTQHLIRAMMEIKFVGVRL